MSALKRLQLVGRRVAWRTFQHEPWHIGTVADVHAHDLVEIDCEKTGRRCFVPDKNVIDEETRQPLDVLAPAKWKTNHDSSKEADAPQQTAQPAGAGKS
jgi:hypothetical protein